MGRSKKKFFWIKFNCVCAKRNLLIL
jgi:hypothetical protein